MTRLPTPGGDDGNWGSILNDYLSVALNSDGTLKPFDKSIAGLANVDNTSDVNKPVSTATQAALDLKVDNTITVNTKPLSGDIALTTNDVGEVADKNYVTDANLTAFPTYQTATNVTDAIAAKRPANVLTVATSGGDYTTVQAAVDAAVAAGATVSAPYCVLVMTGVSRIYTPDARVRVICQDDLINTLPGYLANPPIRVHTPSAFVLRQDDGSNTGATATTLSGWWFTANAALTDALNGNAASTPFDYLRRRGIAICQAIPSGQVGAANAFSANQLTTLIRDGAWEITSHTKVHTNIPSSDAERIAAVVTSKTEIEAAIAAATPALSYALKTFIAVGDWAGTSLDMIPHTTEELSSLARLIEQYYEGSQWFNVSAPGIGATRRHFDTIQASITHDNASTIPLVLAQCKSSGTVTTILIHSVAEAGSSLRVAEFKTLIDGLAALILAEKTTCITHIGARNCVLSPASNPGGIVFGTLDVATVPQDSALMNCGAHYALEANAVDANTLHSWTAPNCVVYDGTAGYAAATFRTVPKTGGHYMVQFDFKEASAGNGQAFDVFTTLYADYNSGQYLAAGAKVSYTPTSIWQQGALPFYADASYRGVRVYIDNVAWTAGKGIKLSNFRLVRIG